MKMQNTLLNTIKYFFYFISLSFNFSYGYFYFGKKHKIPKPDEVFCMTADRSGEIVIIPRRKGKGKSK